MQSCIGDSLIKLHYYVTDKNSSAWNSHSQHKLDLVSPSQNSQALDKCLKNANGVNYKPN